MSSVLTHQVTPNIHPHPNAPWAIGIDIGGTNTEIGVVSRHGSCTKKARLATQHFAEVQDFIAAIGTTVHGLIEAQGITAISGIGIGAPNGNRPRGTIEYAPNLPWHGVIPLAEQLRQALACPVILDNDANTAALGERCFGAARHLRDFIMVTLGTGLGSGIVIGGQLIHGSDGFAGELGHTQIIPDGRPCACGRRGCLERYASAPGLVTTTVQLLQGTEKPSSLRAAAELGLTGPQIAAAARAGDEIARHAYALTGRYLAMGLANAVAITNPEAVILAGGPVQAGPLLLDPTRAALRECLHNLYRDKLRLTVSALQAENAGLLGAAASVWALEHHKT